MKRNLLLIIFSLSIISLTSQIKLSSAINWKSKDGIYLNKRTNSYSFSRSFKIPKGYDYINPTISNVKYSNTSIDNDVNVENEISPIFIKSTQRKETYLNVSFNPIITLNGQLKKVVSFEVNYSQVVNKSFSKRSSSYVSNSVLSQNDWYKLGVVNDGIYRITFANLVSTGMIETSIPSNQINLFGNHTGMLPEFNNQYRPDDLIKNSIKMFDGGDNSFDEGDYFLFYAQGPIKWKYDYNNPYFVHSKHLYTDTSFYFIEINSVSPSPKRVQDITSSSSISNNSVNTFNDYSVIENDISNLLREYTPGGSGKLWFGDLYDVETNYNYSRFFPNISTSNSNLARVNFAVTTASGGNSSSFNFNINGSSSSLVLSPPSNVNFIGNAKSESFNFTSSSDNISIGVDFIKGVGKDAQGWMDFIELNVRRNLVMTGSQMSFRDINSIGAGNVSQFTLSSTFGLSEIWEVSDPTNAGSILYTDNGNTVSFNLETDSLREFIAFTGSGYYTPSFKGKIENQDLHGLGYADFIIITHPNFQLSAERLAQFHRDNDNLSVHIVQPQKIFNEFSSGCQDITGIKTFLKMFYDRAGTDPNQVPKYVLLFGDASYDYKGRISPNHNFVPTYESNESFNFIDSHNSDDYYALLDDNESYGTSQYLDLSVGRLPVKSRAEAEAMVDKVISYGTVSPITESSAVCANGNISSNNASWKNKITLVTDDVDAGWETAFTTHAESMAQNTLQSFPRFNLNKIYFDAYKQISTPGGERYPDGQDALKRAVEEGSLIVAYEGHGGEVGWGTERFLDVTTIRSWTNSDRLAAFLTATCEFSRFDDPNRVSAGEYCLLNSNGGAISMFTTTRSVYQNNNENIIEAFFDNVFVQDSNGNPYTLGEIYSITKNTPIVANALDARKFALLGDPALKLAIPKYQVVTTHINDSTDLSSDTINALKKVTIKGFVADKQGNKLTNYNGIIYPLVFDKEKSQKTLGNNPSVPVQISFNIRNNVLYKGKASIENGEFSFTFVAPKDINYEFGDGKISYYATNGEFDAVGQNSDIVIGGKYINASSDEEGPQIGLFMNDENFVSGGITDESPILYAEIFDENGINTSGNGIGHDISAIIDENSSNSIVLNNYYEADLDSYQKGKVSYPFSNLEEGNHTLSLKVWDVHNNSSKKEIDFVVAKSEKLAIDHVLNYPNPFTTRTQFFFEHNQHCSSLDVQIQIYTVSGKLVKTINQKVQTEGFRVDPIEWDAKDDFGDSIGRGTYVYKVKVQNDLGDKEEVFEKLVVLK